MQGTSWLVAILSFLQLPSRSLLPTSGSTCCVELAGGFLSADLTILVSRGKNDFSQNREKIKNI